MHIERERESNTGMILLHIRFTRFSEYFKKYYLPLIKNSPALGLRQIFKAMFNDRAHALPRQCMFAHHMYIQ